MNCPSDGALRAHLDHELTFADSAEVEQHLAVCSACRMHAESISAVTQSVQLHLHSLESLAGEPEVDPQAALARFKATLDQQEEREPFFARLFAARWRYAWAASFAAVVLLGSLAFPSARSFAQRLLATLRIEKVQTVTLDFASLDNPNNRNLTQAIGQMISEKVVVTTDEKPLDASSREAASQLAGFPVQLLSARTDSPGFMVEGAHAFHMTVDRSRLQDVLDQAGRTALLLPATLDGATVSVQVPRAVEVSYGSCSQEKPKPPAQPAPSSSTTPDCLALIEAPSPVVNVPADLNLQQLAETALQLAGMSADQARKFCQTVDWKSTLVLPIPPTVRSYETVNINGIPGTLMHLPKHDRPGYALVWVNNGIIYCLVGWGDPNNAVQLASSLN